MNTPNYKESTLVTGTSWQRAGKVIITNPYGGTPYMNIVEEKIFQFEGTQLTQPASGIVVSFDINNPLHLQMYSICNAIYVEEREKRDNPPAPEPVIEEPVIEEPIIEEPI